MQWPTRNMTQSVCWFLMVVSFRATTSLGRFECLSSSLLALPRRPLHALTPRAEGRCSHTGGARWSLAVVSVAAAEQIARVDAGRCRHRKRCNCCNSTTTFTDFHSQCGDSVFVQRSQTVAATLATEDKLPLDLSWLNASAVIMKYSGLIEVLLWVVVPHRLRSRLKADLETKKRCA